MGKPTATTAAEPPSITHFSHPHPLHLSNNPPNPHCSACNLPTAAAAATYVCIINNCNFGLHQKCSQLPHQITHPFDHQHALTLYPKPVYPEGLFNCDACGNRGDAFSYHCSPCGVDLHTTCASLPLNLTHRLHNHALDLTFSAPYQGNSFSCDICKKLGSKTWLYRCAACEFDVHLTCVAAVVPPPVQRPRSFVPPQNRPPNNGYGGYQGGVAAQPVYGGVRPVNRLGDQILLAAVEGVAGGVAQTATGVLFQEVFGVGGGGGSGGGGGNGICVDVSGMDGGASVDGAAGDGGYGGGDGSY